ncbi:hypothetical protein MCBG_04776, partial [Micromonospora sp. M42]
MLRQQDVGHRIVVRRIVGIREGRTLFSDALGELVELSETHITLATDAGPLRVPVAEVHRAKRVPPARRPTAAAVVALELAADEAWPAPVRGRLGDWRLRWADGWTGRANSALPVGDPDRPLPAALDAVQRWYAERGRHRAGEHPAAAGRPGRRRTGRARLDGPAPGAGAERAAARPGRAAGRRARRHAAGCRHADRRPGRHAAARRSGRHAAGDAGRRARRRLAGDRRGSQGRPAGRRAARAHGRRPGPLRGA